MRCNFIVDFFIFLNEHKDMKNKPTQFKFAPTVLIVFFVHIALAGVFLGNVAYGNQPINKHNEVSSDKVYAGVEEALVKPVAPVISEQPIAPHTPQELPKRLEVKETIKPVAPHEGTTNNSTNIQVNSNKKTTSYTVKSGDTLYGIARKYKLNLNRLKQLNNIQNTNKIFPGQTLKFM
jgi:LysM repeat protein